MLLVPNEHFTEVARNGIPNLNPRSIEYEQWWLEEARRCKYGYSVGGRYMPGKLYWYVNYWPIELEDKVTKKKKIGLPYLRDVEWEVFSLIERARGFRGNFDEILRPIYEANCMGFMWIAGRGIGKTFAVSSMVGHEFTFFRNNEIIVSGYETKYTNPHLKKVKFGLDYQLKNARPFYHRREVKDDWRTEVWASHKVKEGGSWVESGYMSRIRHIVSKDNHTAANGLRASLHVMEEIGMCQNLVDFYNSSKECWMNGAEQFGVPFLLGTGGDMQSGTIGAQQMFYDPETYNLLTFEDKWEGGGKIAYFTPATYSFNQFRDEQGNADTKAAEAYLEKRREKLRNGKDKRAYLQELQYQPLSHKEAFLTITGNVFPLDLLQEQLTALMSDPKLKDIVQRGDLHWEYDESGKKTGRVLWKPDAMGPLQIVEHPEDGTPFGLYIGGMDPYRQEQAEESDSLGSTIIWKRMGASVEKSYDLPVAQYTARPRTLDEFYEKSFMLAVYYNARILYENEVKGCKEWAERHNLLHHLLPQPQVIKDISPNSVVQRQYGIHQTQQIKEFSELKFRDWLLEGGYKRLFFADIVQEAIRYNSEGNFDRMIAVFMCVLHGIELHKVSIQEAKTTPELVFRFYRQTSGGQIVWT